MPGLVPGIHVLRTAWQGVDGRDKPGHDGETTSRLNIQRAVEIRRRVRQRAG
jgi:hypothetical protein